MPTNPNHPQARVLIVENDFIRADEIRARLESLSYRVIDRAATEQEALVVMEKDRPDLVLMDIDLGGGLDGIQAAEKIWSEFEVPTVFVTGCEDLERLEKARLVLPFGYVLMPFQGADLRVTIERVLSVAEKDAERRALEKRLKESESRFRLLYERAPLGYQSLDIHGNFLEVNQAWLDTLGYTRDEVIGRNFSEFLHPDWRDHFRMNFPRFKAVGEVLGVEFEMVKKDGAIILVSFNGKIGRDERGEFRQTHCILHDISERNRMESDLRRKTEELDRFFNLAADLLCIADLDGNFRRLNPQWEKVLGYPLEEIENRRYLDFVHPDDLEVTNQAMDALSRKEPLIDFVNRYRCRDGSYKWIEWRTQPGETVVYAAARDITARRQAEEEKRRLEDQLRHAQKMEAVGTLAGGIAHDFNNLLQVINGYAQILLYQKKPNEPGYREASEIQKAGARASQLVKQLLAFGHKAEVNLRPVDLNREVEHAEKMLRRVLPKMVDIRLHLESQPLTVNADPVQIEQMLLNLGSNAADAMPDGGALTIETKNLMVDEVDCRERPELSSGRYLLLTVTDTGHGMDQETLTHIFEPFFTTKEVGRGTGLGLSSVYGIVRSHGGGIFCHSEPGQGAAFDLYFPAVEGLVRTDGDGRLSDIPRGGTECILLVDDEAPIREFAGQALARFGYTIRAASRGEEALEIFSASRDEIDMVILDLGMPGMGGFKCLTELLRIKPEARIVIASGYTSTGQVQDAIRAGAAAYIAKPYLVAELLTATRRVLDKTLRKN